MSTIHLHHTTTSTPEQFLSALIDFGPGRSKIFGNLWGGNSGHTYSFSGRPDGKTEDAVVVRDGKNLKGRALVLVLGTVGRGVLEKAFGNTLKAIETRNSGAKAN